MGMEARRKHRDGFRRWLSAATVALAMPYAASSHAADIHYVLRDDTNIIAIDGEIIDGDYGRFKAVSVNSALSTLVLLSSPGGDLYEALRIGEVIHANGYTTGVPDGFKCASACGLIWLAGRKRALQGDAKVGFHAAYHFAQGVPVEGGQANAMVGAYVTRLGLPLKVVAFVTAAAPEEMRWLYPAEAMEIGLDVTYVPVGWSDHLSPSHTPALEPAAPASAPAPSPNPPPRWTGREQVVLDFVISYFKAASGTGVDVAPLAQFYPTTVNYYGGNQARAKVMDEKRKFAERWPDRHYGVNTNSFKIQCGSLCTASGVVAWDAKSYERGVHSTGTANIAFQISGDGPLLILSENGSVINRVSESLSAPSAPTASSPDSALAANTNPTTQAFADGRMARLTYEDWVSKLPDGDYRNGVMYWAGNRSNKPPPACAVIAQSADWLSGCTAARERLTPIDTRRRSEPDFKLGWNSV